jgi:hypothetical protein
MGIPLPVSVAVVSNILHSIICAGAAPCRTPTAVARTHNVLLSSIESPQIVLLCS